MPTNARPKQTPKEKHTQTIPPDVLATVVDALATALVQDFERKKVLDNGMHIATIAPTLGRGPSDE